MIASGLGACDRLLEIELPHLLTETAIEGAGTAELQVNSAIALFECGYSAFGLMALGADDAMTSVQGVGNGNNQFTPTASSGVCDNSDTTIAWFDQIMGARGMLSTAPARFSAAATTAQGQGKGVYDRIQDEWGVGGVGNGERLSAIAAIYVAMSLAHFGEFTCEAALDGSDLLTPTDMLDMAEDWITNRALGHISAAGTSLTNMPHGITTSATASTGGTAEEMALAIRARVLWANGNLAGADADAASVLGTRSRFAAWITRDAGATRRNKIWFTNTLAAYSGMMPLNIGWVGVSPNPATGQPWQRPIPFTGYMFLGVMPDGSTLTSGTYCSGAGCTPLPVVNIPVRYAQEGRTQPGDIVDGCNVAPVEAHPGCVVGAVPDTRVTHVPKNIQTGRYEVPTRYGNATGTAGGDTEDIPYMTWEELTLIRADYANSQNDQAAAIAFVNGIRTAKSLPTIVDPYLTTLTDGSNDQAEVRAMLLEERRRELFSEAGRYFSTKIQNTDMLWFPRAEGRGLQYVYQGAVRMLFSADEYTNNQHFVDRGREAARGTGCANLGPLPGSQVPVF